MTRADALKEALAIAREVENQYWRPLRVYRTNEQVAIDEGKRDVAEEIANAIEALIAQEEA